MCFTAKPNPINHFEHFSMLVFRHGFWKLSGGNKNSAMPRNACMRYIKGKTLPAEQVLKEIKRSISDYRYAEKNSCWRNLWSDDLVCRNCVRCLLKSDPESRKSDQKSKQIRSKKARNPNIRYFCAATQSPKPTKT